MLTVYLFSVGGRKFGFLSLAPLGCFPAVEVLVNGTEGSCREENSALGRMHNSALSVRSWRNSLKDLNIHLPMSMILLLL